MRLDSSPKVSVGLPVYNGENFLEEALDSLLGQTFEAFELIISNNASTDRTEEICQAYAAQDKRVRYFRNEKNIGAAGNYTRVFELASGKYFKWAAHDDVCKPDYLARCLEVLDRDPSVVLCHSLTANIDENSQCLMIWDAIPELDSQIPHNRFRQALALQETFFVWGLIRRTSLEKTSLLGSFTGHDRPLLSRLSLLGRFYQIPEVLFLQREHNKKSIHVYNWRKPREAIIWYDPKKAGKIIFPTWKLFIEHVLGVVQAKLSWRENMVCYTEMGRWLRSHKQVLLRELLTAGENLPGIGSKWLKWLDPMSKDIASVITDKSTIILVDDNSLETESFGERKIIPFLEKDGLYWGSPPDDDTAILELERLRQFGPSFIVFAWPAFWWLDHYVEFNRHLRLQFDCVLENDRLVVFDLRREVRNSGRGRQEKWSDCRSMKRSLERA